MYDRPAVSPEPLLTAAIRTVARAADPDTALDALLDLARQAADAKAAVVLLWDADRGALAVAGANGTAESMKADLEARAANPGDSLHRAAHDRTRVIDGQPGATSAWPIVVSGGGVEEPLGVLALFGAAVLDASTADEIGAVADLVGLLVDRARLASDSAERSDWHDRLTNSDALTGLANARTLARVVELEIARAARQGSELCVALFDIDGLTRINTDGGRAAGDAVLREVAAVAAESIRFVDTVARWGGDEFMLVAPGATGTTVVKRIVEAVAARPAIAGRQYTVSAGLARFPADGTSGDALVESATRALHAAQAAGPGTLAESAADAAPKPTPGVTPGPAAG